MSLVQDGQERVVGYYIGPISHLIWSDCEGVLGTVELIVGSEWSPEDSPGKQRTN